MANWVTTEEADVLDNQPGALVAAYKTAALAAGQTNPLPRITQDVVNLVRNKVASSPSNYFVDDDTTKIPASLKWIAVAIIVSRLATRLAKPLTDDQNKELDRAWAELNRIADGRDTVEDADTPVDPPAQSGSNSPRICRRETHFSRRDQEGI